MDTPRRSRRLIPPPSMAVAMATAMSVAMLVAAPLRAAEVFKTVDAEGHVVYTDHADPHAPTTTVAVNTMSAKQAAKAAKLRAAQTTAGQQHRKQQALEAAKTAQLDRDAKRQCDDAQKNFYTLKAAGGTDAASALKREQARQSMVLACTD